MQFKTPLIEATFLKRYKRFFADVEINGKIEVAHVANTGSLRGCLEPGASCLVSPAEDPARKLRFSLEMIQTPTSWVGINTSLPNKLIYDLWKNQRYAPWTAFDRGQMEVKINSETRLDMALWKSSDVPQEKLAWKEIKPPLHFIEIKNVTLSDGQTALFPDAVTERGQKHLSELMLLMDQGYSCEIVFLIQRSDCTQFSPADVIDAKYGQLLRDAKKRGVQITPLSCSLSPQGIQLNTEPLKVVL